MLKKLKTKTKTIKNKVFCFVYIRIYKTMSKVLTSVKVDNDAYIKFKELNINQKFNFQELVNRSLYLYLQDDSFRNTVYNYNISSLSQESQKTILPSIKRTTD